MSEQTQNETAPVEINSQIAEHAPFGGVVPEIAARAHVESIDRMAASWRGPPSG